MRGFINVQDRTFTIKLHLHLQISQSQWCEFLFAGGDVERSSLYLCVGGDVGDTDISFLLLWEVLVVLVKEVWKRVVLLVGKVLQPTGQGQGHMTNKQLQ